MSERYDAIKKMLPENRVESSNNLLLDRIRGILVAYSQKLEDKKFWIDESTLADAEYEFIELLQDYVNGKYNKKI